METHGCRHGGVIGWVVAVAVACLYFQTVAEESYYFLKGEGRIVVEDEEATVLSGQAVSIPPTKRHKIVNIGETDLEFIAICVPAWEPTHTQYLESFGR